MSSILKLLCGWFLLSIPLAFFIGLMFRVTKPFDGLSCPKCGKSNIKPYQDTDEFICGDCEHVFDDPIETLPMFPDQPVDDRTRRLINPDMLKGDETS